MNRLYLLSVLSFLMSCTSSSLKKNADSTTIHQIYRDSSLNFVKDDNGTLVEKGKIDSLTWILYTANFESDALHGEDKKMPKLRPVQCDFLFRHITILGKDTTQYFFSFYYKDPKVFYLLDPDFFVGVGTIKNVNRYLVGAYFKMDIPATPELSTEFFAKRDKMFQDYLKNYKGEMSDWLRKEAIRRRVIDK
jgi:hypothetical protein